jgi:integrase
VVRDDQILPIIAYGTPTTKIGSSSVSTARPRRASRRRKSTFGTVQQLASGRFQARYASPIDGKRVPAPRTFDDATTAWAWLAKERPLTEDPATWVPPKDRLRANLASRETFGDYSQRWLAQRNGLKPRTRSEYARLLGLLGPTFDATPVHQVTRGDIKAWHSTFSEGRPTQRARAYGLLKTIMKEAVADGLIERNPVDINGASTVDRARTIDVLAPTELHNLADAMPARWRALVYVSALCMLREGEAFELRRGDIDLQADVPVIRVTRSVSRVSIDGTMHRVIGTPKSRAGVRNVPIHADLAPLLQDHLDRYVAKSKDALVFPATDGGHLSPSTLYGRPPTRDYPGRGFYAARVAAGRPDLNWHALRHTGAVYMAQTGATVAELMALLGHASVDVAMRYQHVAADRPAHNIQRLAQLIQIPPREVDRPAKQVDRGPADPIGDDENDGDGGAA